MSAYNAAYNAPPAKTLSVARNKWNVLDAYNERCTRAMHAIAAAYNAQRKRWRERCTRWHQAPLKGGRGRSANKLEEVQSTGPRGASLVSTLRDSFEARDSSSSPSWRPS